MASVEDTVAGVGTTSDLGRLPLYRRPLTLDR